MFLLRRKPKITFRIKLAGVPVEVHALYPQTREFCRDYLTKEEPAFSVYIGKEDIRRERKRYAAQMAEEGHSRRYYALSYMETLALCRKVMTQLLPCQVLLVHGAVMAAGGKAYLFTAPSGTGKTTHCRLWLKNFLKSHILNGDKPLLLFREGKVYACGSPWMGKEKYGVNEMLPLEAICLLERDAANHIEKIAMKDCLAQMLQQCHVPDGSGSMLAVFQLIQQLAAVRLYRLGCNQEDEAAQTSYNAMVK